MEKKRSAPKKTNRTAFVEQNIQSGTDFDETMDLIKDLLVQKSIQDYFHQLLNEKKKTSAEVVKEAGLDKDFGNQILTGKRRTRRDNYIRIGIALCLTFSEIQSMLKFLQTGSIYVLRQRDAMIMFCVEKKKSVTDTQDTLFTFGFEPLGDGGYHTDDDFPIKASLKKQLDTRQVEQIIAGSSDFYEVLEKTSDKLIKGTIEKYFDDHLQHRGINKRDLFDITGITPNTGYQLLRGVRRSKNRDVYLKIAIAIGLNIDETQRMLKLLDVGVIYPVVERDAVIYYGMKERYSLDMMQDWIVERGFLPL